MTPGEFDEAMKREFPGLYEKNPPEMHSNPEGSSATVTSKSGSLGGSVSVPRRSYKHLSVERKTRDYVIEYEARKRAQQEILDKNSPPITVEDLASIRTWKPPEFLVDGAVPAVGVAQMVGDFGTLKSLLALDLALRVASPLEGDEWFGRPLRKHGDVLFFALESSNELPVRVQAWETYHEREVKSFYAIRGDSVHFDIGHLDKLRAAIKEASINPALLIIDTQSRATSGRDENDNTAMAEAINEVKVLASEFECLALLIHHTGHSDKSRERGASAQVANIDLSLVCEYARDTNRGTATTRKIKGVAYPDPFGYSLEVVGDSVVVVPATISIGSTAAEVLIIRRKIIDAVRDDPFKSKTVVYRKVGGRKEVVLEQIDALIEEGEVVNIGSEARPKLVLPGTV